MSEFENQHRGAHEICCELSRTLIGLGIDWQDEASLRRVAREALAYDAHKAPQIESGDIEGRTKRKLFGLIALMHRTLQEGAEVDREVHGDEVWKALAKALWAEKKTLS